MTSTTFDCPNPRDPTAAGLRMDSLLSKSEATEKTDKSPLRSDVSITVGLLSAIVVEPSSDTTPVLAMVDLVRNGSHSNHVLNLTVIRVFRELGGEDARLFAQGILQWFGQANATEAASFEVNRQGGFRLDSKLQKLLEKVVESRGTVSDDLLQRHALLSRIRTLTGRQIELAKGINTTMREILLLRSQANHLRQQFDALRTLGQVSEEELAQTAQRNSELRELLKAKGALPENWSIAEYLEVIGANALAANDSSSSSESLEHLEFVKSAKANFLNIRSALISARSRPEVLEQARKEEGRLQRTVFMQEEAVVYASDKRNLEEKTVAVLSQIVAGESIRLETVAVIFAENIILTDLMQAFSEAA